MNLFLRTSFILLFIMVVIKSILYVVILGLSFPINQTASKINKFVFLQQMKESHTHSPSPSLSVDAIVPRITNQSTQVLIIKRNQYPIGYALPGGHVEVGETIQQAITRELKEETNLTLKNSKLFNIYSDPSRDPREHNIAIVLIVGIADEYYITPGSDAGEVFWYDIHELKQIPLVFDHNKIVNDFISYIHKDE